jgi:hypothetical protein
MIIYNLIPGDKLLLIFPYDNAEIITWNESLANIPHLQTKIKKGNWWWGRCEIIKLPSDISEEKMNMLLNLYTWR